MDFGILLYLSMIFYTIQCSSQAEDNLEHLNSQLERAIEAIQSITSDVESLKTKLQIAANAEFELRAQKIIEIVDSDVEDTVRQFNKYDKSALAKSKSEWKVKNCLKEAANRLSSIPDSTTAALETCQDDGTGVTAIKIQSLDEITMGGDHLNRKLDSISNVCGNSNLTRVTRCIAICLNEIDKDIQVFTTDAAKKKKEIQSSVINIFKTFKQCTSDIVDAARDESEKVKQDANLCLQRA